MIAHNILREMQVKSQCQSKSFRSKKKVKVLLLQDEMSSEVYTWQELTQEVEIEFINRSTPNFVTGVNATHPPNSPKTCRYLLFATGALVRWILH